MLIFIHMLRTILFAAFLMLGVVAKAQTDPSFGTFKPSQQTNDTNHIYKKWFVTKYAGISTGFVAFKGGSGSFLSVPLAWQLNRQLTNNLFAFGSVSVTPSVFRYNSMPYEPIVNKSGSLVQPNHFAAYPDAKIGVMYISNDRTFSISGSVGVSRGSYYGYSPFYGPAYAPMQGGMQR